MGLKALTVIVYDRDVRGDVERARIIATETAGRSGFTGVPAHEQPGDYPEPGWTFRWEEEFEP